MRASSISLLHLQPLSPSSFLTFFVLFCTAPVEAEQSPDTEMSSGSSPSLNELPLIGKITCNGTSAIHTVNIWEDAFPGEVQSCPRWPHVLRRSSAALDGQGNLMACRWWALVEISKAVEKAWEVE